MTNSKPDAMFPTPWFVMQDERTISLYDADRQLLVRERVGRPDKDWAEALFQHIANCVNTAASRGFHVD